MRKSVYSLLLLAVFGLTFTSCVSKKKFTELLNDKEGIAATLSETQKKVADLESQKADLEKTKADLESENSNLSAELSTAKRDLESSQKEVAQTKTMLSEKEAKVTTYEKGIKGVFSPYAGSGLNIGEREDRLYVMMEEPITFRSGSTRVDRASREKLASLAEVLKNNPGLSLQVEGHADNAKFLDGKGNNWNLSINRAMNVVSYLLRQGVSPNQLSAVGRGEFAPAVSDDPSSKEARAKNRRVEFVVVPAIGSIYSVKP